VHGNVSLHAARARATVGGVQEAHHATVAVSEGGRNHPAAPASYLAPKRPRRAYGDKASTTAVRSSQPEPDIPAAVMTGPGSEAFDGNVLEVTNCA
jgi:hypothetical protein